MRTHSACTVAPGRGDQDSRVLAIRRGADSISLPEKFAVAVTQSS